MTKVTLRSTTEPRSTVVQLKDGRWMEVRRGNQTALTDRRFWNSEEEWRSSLPPDASVTRADRCSRILDDTTLSDDIKRIRLVGLVDSLLPVRDSDERRHAALKRRQIGIQTTIQYYTDKHRQPSARLLRELAEASEPSAAFFRAKRPGHNLYLALPDGIMAAVYFNRQGFFSISKPDDLPVTWSERHHGIPASIVVSSLPPGSELWYRRGAFLRRLPELSHYRK